VGALLVLTAFAGEEDATGTGVSMAEPAEAGAAPGALGLQAYVGHYPFQIDPPHVQHLRRTDQRPQCRGHPPSAHSRGLTAQGRQRPWREEPLTSGGKGLESGAGEG
jgi:hypothetical protein